MPRKQTRKNRPSRSARPSRKPCGEKHPRFNEGGKKWSVRISRLVPQKGGDSLNAQIADLQKRKARLEAMLRNPQRIRILINSQGFPEEQEHQVRHVQAQLQDVVLELNLLERSRRSRNEDPTNPNENENPQPLSGGKRNTRRLRR
jgi:hypothetical protein